MFNILDFGAEQMFLTLETQLWGKNWIKLSLNPKNQSLGKFFIEIYVIFGQICPD